MDANADEVSLLDLWRMFQRQRRVALTAFTAVITLAVVYLALAPRTYESEASIYIGQLNGVSIEPPAPILERLEARYGKKQAIREGADLWLSRITQNRQDGRMIQITSSARSRDDAYALAQKAIDEIVIVHQKRFAEQAQRLRREVSVLEELLAAGRVSRKSIGGTYGSTLGALYSSVELAAIERRIADLHESLDGVKTSPTEVLQAPIRPRDASSPRVGLAIAVAIVLAMIAAFVSVLLAEFIGRSAAKVADPAVS